MSDSDIIPKIDSSDGKLKKIGFGLTFVWLALVIIYAVIAWSKVIAMSPHDLADSLGGVFAPLAFLWLVLGYLQQGEELRHSVEALRLQSVELSHSVEQQRQLVEATRDQIAQEREMLAAEEAAATRAAAPLFKLRDGKRQIGDNIIIRDFHLTNVGKACRNVVILVQPYNKTLDFPVLDNQGSCRIRLSHGRGDDLRAQDVSISYLDERNAPGEQRFSIPLEDDPACGITWGQPLSTFPPTPQM